MNTKTILAAFAMFALGIACTPSEPEVEETVSQKVTATVVDNGAATAWTKSDVLGVYTDASENNVKYTAASAGTSVSFTAATEVKGTPKYAYYPYNSNNSSKKATGLAGTVVQDQTNGAVNYMYGVQTGTNNDGDVTFEFHKVLADVVFTVETAGSALEGQNIVSLTCKVTRNGAAVPVCGGFSFSAADGSFSYTGNTTYNEFTTVSKSVVFPTVKAGDVLTVVAKSAEAEATAELTVEADLVAGGYYPVTVKLPEVTVEPEQPEEPETPEEPELPAEPETITGTFTCATYNIKGSSNGTIGTMITNDAWDFFHFSECFRSYSKNLGSYTFGTKSSTLGDGLYFASRNATCSFSNEYRDEYDNEYGGIFAGANTPVAKGFRYYLVTLANGVQVDVYITHMNTYDTQKHLDCQHKQLQEVATWIANHRNGRPVIFMGDTNCRYTRHDFETYFWSIIRAEGITINDPWVDYMWDGVYPEYPSKSLMVSDATGTNPDTDIICADTQHGEVVDKVIYINDANADTQIKANGYLRDMDYEGLSDHMPVVIEFTYTKTL